MRDGFVRAAAATPEIRVADCAFNEEKILAEIRRAAAAGVQVLALPELCLTGYTCGDLFFSELLQREAQESLLRLRDATAELDLLAAVGLPLAWRGKLYNVAAVLSRGKVLGFVPKKHLPNYNEFYERRQFTPAPEGLHTVILGGEEIPFGTDLLFSCRELPALKVGVELCEDLWSPLPPSTRQAMAGATVVLNLSASDEVVGKAGYRRELVTGQSARLLCGYVYADAGYGESTTDMTFSGHNLVAENGVLLAQGRLFRDELIYSEIDTYRLLGERRKNTTFPGEGESGFQEIPFSLEYRQVPLSRGVEPRPFLPPEGRDRDSRCEDILSIQSQGLRRRIEHSHSRTAVVGVSGGLDSTLALLVAARALDLLGRPRTDLVAVTMPCFGTTRRTKSNAVLLAERLGATLREVDITEAVRRHFQDIGHEESDHSVTFENSQARERTQVLMDIANQTGGLVVGTGDLSELALGWATYNGDHISMYGVNASVPKTLIRYIVAYEARRSGDEKLRAVLEDVLDTPVSPELLPAENGEISQRTEELVGPYELHDFYLYYLVRWAFSPRKVLRLAETAFAGQYSRETMISWLKVFCRRFFAQQFKRSCLPDGPKVGSVTLSPRGDWRMPSDASAALWLREVEQREKGQELGSRQEFRRGCYAKRRFFNENGVL